MPVLDTNCLICFNPYETVNRERKPCIGTCGHTVCLTCKASLPLRDCPFCRCKSAFEGTTYNYDIIDFIEYIKTLATQDKVTCPRCKSENQILRVCKQCGEERGYLSAQFKHTRIKIDRSNRELSNGYFKRTLGNAKCASCMLDEHQSMEHNFVEFPILRNEFDFIMMADRRNKAVIDRSRELSANADRLADRVANSTKSISQNLNKLGPNNTKEMKASFNKYQSITEKMHCLSESLLRINRQLKGLAPPSGISRCQKTGCSGNPFLASTRNPEKRKIRPESISTSDSNDEPAPAKRAYNPALFADNDPCSSRELNTSSPVLIRKFGEINIADMGANDVPSAKINTILSVEADVVPSEPGTSQEHAAGTGKAQKIVFDKSKKTVAYDKNDKIAIIDRCQNSIVDPLRPGMYDVATGTYCASEKPLVTRQDHLNPAKMLNFRAKFAVARNDEFIFVIGGIIQLNYAMSYLTSIEAYNCELNHKGEVAVMNTPRSQCSALIYNNKLYIVGGYNSNEKYMDTVETWDFEGRECELQKGKINYARIGGVLIEFGGKMLLLGGYNGDDYVDQIEMYDEETGTWCEYGYMEGGRAGFSATVFEDRIYIAGGWNSNKSECIKTMKSFHVESKVWSEETSMQEARRYFTLATIKVDGKDDHLLAIRGCGDRWAVHESIEKYYPNGNNIASWEMA